MNKFIKRILGAATAVAVAVGSLGAVPGSVLPSLSVVASAELANKGELSAVIPNGKRLESSDSGIYTVSEDTVLNGIIALDQNADIVIEIASGKTLTVNKDNGHAINIMYPTSTLTVRGGGSLIVNTKGNTNYGIWINNGKLIIDNVSVTANKSEAILLDEIVRGNGASLTIKNGATITDTVFKINGDNPVTVENSTLSGCTISNAAITNSTISGSTVTGGTITGSTVTGGTIKSSTVTNSTVGGEVIAQAIYNENGSIVYTVKFDLNGANGSIDSQTISSGGKATAPTAPTRTGYTFKGWYTTAACETEFDFANTTITADTTLYAKWLQHITYIDAAGEEQTVGDDEDYTLVTSSTTSWSGTMVAMGEVSINGQVTLSGDTILILCDGASLTVNGTDNGSAIGFTTLNIYGQSGGSGTLAVVSGSGYYDGGIDVTNLTINGGTVISSGYTAIKSINDVIINGGTVTATGSSQGIRADNLTIKSGNTTATGNTGVFIDNDEYNGSATFDWTKPTDSITIQNIVFYDDEKGSVKFTKPFILSGTNTLATADNIAGKTIVPAYKVTFNANGGYFGDDTTKTTFDKGAAATGTAKVTAPTAPKHATLFFAGWYTDESCTDGNKFDFSTAITADTTLYAKWAEITFTKVPAKAATCTAAGNKEYYKGSDNKYYTFADGVYTETTLAAVTIAKLGHNMTAHAAKGATCTTAGNTAYWYCDRCEKYFSDANGTNQIAEDSWVIPATGHTLTLIAEVPATCKDAGVKSHYKCTVCEKLFTDAQGENETTLAAVTIAKLGHNYENGKCTRCGEADPDYKEPDNGGNGGGGNGGGGYTPVIPSYPSGGGNTTNTTTDNSNEPKIEGGSGASGWSNIASEISKTPEGGSVTVDMAGTTTVPKSVLDAVKGKDVDLVLDMGEGIKWTINGKDVTDVSGSIDLGVTVGKSEIPADIINNVSGEKYNVEIHLNYSGNFGFKATLTLDMRKQDAGLIANLFFYDPADGQLKFVSSGRIKADGTVDLEFGHASDYTIVVDDHELGKELTATVSRTGNVKLSWTAQDGAESYNVYRAIDGKWVKLGTTSKTTYTVKSLTNNKTYKFMVRAKINGKLVAKADAMTLKVKVYYKPAPKATTADGRITLTWKEVPYATKYRIYVVKNGKYVKLKDTKKLTYSTSATVGKTYKFAVKAYVNGKWTSVKASDIIKIKAK